jgi:hypothetical protein
MQNSFQFSQGLELLTIKGNTDGKVSYLFISKKLLSSKK